MHETMHEIKVFIYMSHNSSSEDDMVTIVYLLCADTGEIILKETLSYSIYGGNDDEISYIIRNYLVYSRKNRFTYVGLCE